MSEIDARTFRDACGTFATGVNVITTHCDGHEHGMTANAFMSISLNPALVAISIAEKAKMLPKIQKSGRFAVSVLACGMGRIAWHFAGKPDSQLVDLFDDLDGLPVIKGSVASFSATVHDEILAGDHTIFIGKVRHVVQDLERRPVLFFRGKFGEFEDAGRAPSNMLQAEAELMW